MKTKKLSLANIQGKLSRYEMKKLMAGSGSCNVGASCWQPINHQNGTCLPSGLNCYCVAGGKGAESPDCDNIA